MEAILWTNGPVCPHCGSRGRIYVLNGVRTKPSKKSPNGVAREGLKKCGQCRHQFTVRIGTIFEESHLGLHLWLQAIHLMRSGKNGISAHQLHGILEVTYKTAWLLANRIREATRDDKRNRRIHQEELAKEILAVGKKNAARLSDRKAQIDKFKEAAHKFQTNADEAAFDQIVRGIGKQTRNIHLIGSRIIPSE